MCGELQITQCEQKKVRGEMVRAEIGEVLKDRLNLITLTFLSCWDSLKYLSKRMERLKSHEQLLLYLKERRKNECIRQQITWQSVLYLLREDTGGEKGKTGAVERVDWNCLCYKKSSSKIFVTNLQTEVKTMEVNEITQAEQRE